MRMNATRPAAKDGEGGEDAPEGPGLVGEGDAGDVHAEDAADHRQRHEDHGDRGEDQHGLVHLLGAGVEDLLVDQHRALRERLQLVAEAGAAGGGLAQADAVAGGEEARGPRSRGC